MVLAMAASEIAPCRGYGEGFRAWIEMEKGLFLYGVNVV
jgi:phage tail sheath protein FI